MSRSVSMFILHMTPTTRSTLFPYTTLFRSDRGVHRLRGAVRRRLAPPAPGANDLRQGRVVTERDLGMRSVSGCIADRKSTRLNSSHLVISYAVFCLTKKIRSLPVLIAVTWV